MRPSPEMIQDVREYPILYVDDEAENLRIFELTFRRQFGIYTAISAEKGLEILNSKPVAVVLSDHRMPGMTGTEFLARVAEIDPHTIRIMVTAYGDAETLEDAINNGAIYHFIAKPWNPDDVRVTLLRAIQAYALERERGQLLQELTVVSRVSAALTQELALDRLIELITRTLRVDLDFDGASLLVFDRKQGALEWARTEAARDETDQRLARLRFTRDNASRFLQQLEDGRSLTLRGEDLLDYSATVREWVSEVAAEEILVMPLFGKSGLIGAITVDNRRGRRRFQAEDVTLIEGIANQASIALENARLVEDLRRTRGQLRRADRLGTLGTLAAGLAHEINNPLTAIHTFLSLAPEKRHEDDAEFWGDYYQVTRQEVERIRRLVGTMKSVGQEGVAKGARETFDPRDVAADVVELLRREAELGRVSLRSESDARTPKIVGVRDHVHQVVLNLVLNALEVTPAGGTVTLATAASPDGGVMIEVRDEGPGIPPEHLEQIFDPFFTTKEDDGGTGLGLMVCHHIVSDHGGTIEVHNREGGGTSFLVRLPPDCPASAA